MPPASAFTVMKYSRLRLVFASLTAALIAIGVGEAQDKDIARAIERQFKEMMDKTDRAVEANPNDVTLRLQRGYERLLMIPDYDGALADFERAVQLDPRSSDAYCGRGKAKHGKGDNEGAVADLDRAIVLDARNSDAYLARGYIRKIKGDLDAAIPDYDIFIQMKPSDPRGYRTRGEIEWLKSLYDRAVTDLSKAIRLGARDAATYALRGRAKWNTPDTKGAIGDLTEAIELSPNDASIYWARGAVWLTKGDYAKALADYEKCLSLKGENPEYARFLIQLLRLRLGRASGNDLLEHSEAWKDDWAKTIARLLRGKISSQELIATAEAVSDPKKRSGNLCEAYYYAGMTELLHGDTAGARAKFRACLETGRSTYFEYKFARAELERLK
jgi:tetratricopeptide (TPR) repeat protein